jgi:hypothetical protein
VPETYTPFTWVDGSAGGTPITAARLNSIETGIESMDDRTAALELNILAPVTVTYAASVTIDAATGALFHITATGALTIAAISNPTNGQLVTIQVLASGADRVVSFSVGGVASGTVTSGTWATWTLRYNSGTSTWALGATSLAGGAGGTYTDEQAQDAAAAMIAAGTHSGITFTYDDVNNKISATVTSAEGATYTGNKTINGRFGVNKTTSVKQPVNIGSTLNAATVAGNTDDKVGIELSANFTGDFTGDTGSNPGFAWGLNLFATTGSAASDGKGLSNLTGALLEMSIGTPSGTTFPVVRGLQAEAAFYGASAGCTVTQMESMRVSAPKRKDGAVAGTATNVYCLFVEDPGAYPVGATNAWALFVEGGVSRFQGRMDVSGTILSYNSSLSLQGDYSGAGVIQLTTNNIGFFGVTPVARQSLPASGTVTAANIRQALINLGLCV